MEVLKYLTTKSITDLTKEFSIKATFHKEHPELVLLKYNQIDSPMGNPIVQECRGIILNTDNWSVVSRPYSKFFNHGEGHAAPIDWNTASVLEKLDGSLTTMYWYKGKWHVSSSGVPDGTSEVGDFGMTFAELFWRVFKESKYELPKDTTKCYVFELMTPFNRIVVRQDFNRLVLTGVRDITTLKEEAPDPKYGFEVVKKFSDLASFDALDGTFKDIDPVRQEGYVVVDANFNRVKVKHPGYVALHHMAGGMSKKAMLQLVRANEKTEFLTYFPEYQGLYDEVKGKYDDLVAKIWIVYNDNAWHVVQKDFAMAVAGTAMPGACFALRAKKVETVEQYLAQIQIDNLMSSLGLKSE